MVSLPEATVARSALAHDAAFSEVAESLLEHPETTSAVEISTTEIKPKRFFTVAPFFVGAVDKRDLGKD